MVIGEAPRTIDMDILGLFANPNPNTLGLPPPLGLYNNEDINFDATTIATTAKTGISTLPLLADMDFTSSPSAVSPFDKYYYQEFLKIDSSNEKNLKALNNFTDESSNDDDVDANDDDQDNYNNNNYSIIKDEIYSYLQLFSLGWRAPIAVQTGDDEVWVGHNYVNGIRPGQLCLFRKYKNKIK